MSSTWEYFKNQQSAIWYNWKQEELVISYFINNSNEKQPEHDMGYFVITTFKIFNHSTYNFMITLITS